MVDTGTADGDYEYADGTAVEVSNTCATCSRCGHQTESYGDGEASELRCLVLMREECPNGESNFYVADDPPPPVRTTTPYRSPLSPYEYYWWTLWNMGKTAGEV